MRHSKIALAAAIAVGGFLSIAGSANATVAATSMSAAADRLTVVDQVQFIFGGHRHCWYADGWNGPGWYWCGYRHRHGYGWGGGEGWHSWHHR
jgi:hypothetical protein